MRNLDLNKYYDLKYIEIESKCSSSKDETKDKEVIYDNNVPLLINMDTANTLNDFISIFNNFLRQDGVNNFIFAFLNQKLTQPFMESLQMIS
jgi:hypothetical protein